MKVINRLIQLGFWVTEHDGNIKLAYTGKTHAPSQDVLIPLLNELKECKDKATEYIKSLIAYEIPEGLNFDFQVSSCVEASYSNDIAWLRADIYKKAKKAVLIGAVKKPDLLRIWLDGLREVNKEGGSYGNYPWLN